MSKLFVLTLNWNGEKRLEKLIPSTQKALQNIDSKWIIRDNGSTDSSVEMIKQHQNICLLEVNHNKDNFSQGVNSCFKESCAQDDDFILLLNNDIEFKDQKSLQNMMKLFDDSSVGIVGAKLSYEDKTIQHAGILFNQKKYPFHFDETKSESKFHKQNREFQAVTGAVLLTKAKYFKNFSSDNGLDEKFFWGFDDVAACLATKYELKKKIVYCGQTNIQHESSASLKINPINKIYLKQNAQRLIDQFGSKIISDENLYTQNHLLFK